MQEGQTIAYKNLRRNTQIINEHPQKYNYSNKP